MRIIQFLLLLLVSATTNAFVPQLAAAARIGRPLSTTTTFLLSNSNNDDNAATPDKPKMMTATEIIIEKRMNPSFVPPTPAGRSPSEKEQKYPLDIPSPILLSSSIFLAIVSTGSIYQFASHPTTVDLTPATIALVGLPSFIFLFYAAITKATAETEEDDKKFLSGK